MELTTSFENMNMLQSGQEQGHRHRADPPLGRRALADDGDQLRHMEESSKESAVTLDLE